MEFQKTVDKAAGNQKIKFTAEICMNDENLTPSMKNHIVTNNEFPFLDTKKS